MLRSTCTAVYCLSFLVLILNHFPANSLENVALTGRAYQSSVSYSGYAPRAIDGNRDPEYGHGSCTHTNLAWSQWWRLLLPVVYRITSISITNRNDFSGRLNNVELLIGNSLENNGNNNPRCTVIPSIPSGGTSSFNCTGMVGRVINVYNKAYEILTLCELEVYGEPAAPSASFSAEVMGRKIEVVEKKLCWSDALLYCREYYWDLLSIRSVEEQSEVEEVLKNATFLTKSFSTPTKHVWLGLRRSLRGSTWFWMSGASMFYVKWEFQYIWQVSSPCGGVDTSDQFYWRSLPCWDNFHFICLKDFETDGEPAMFSSYTP